MTDWSKLVLQDDCKHIWELRHDYTVNSTLSDVIGPYKEYRCTLCHRNRIIFVQIYPKVRGVV